MGTRRIAKLAGVSATAVSLALNNSPRISEVTKRRILNVAERLGYTRNAKVVELMSQMRRKRDPQRDACFGVISFYDSVRPFENAVHLRRIYEGMTQRGRALGYGLEPLWLRAPGMTHRRFRGILDARGIKGLLCFGSPDLDEEFPSELDHYAIVTQGVSIKTPLHRVVSHTFNDMWHVLRKVHQLGYRRPGLVIGDYEGARSAHAYLCVYLGWSHLFLGTVPAIPVLQMAGVEEEALIGWLKKHRPDVLVFAHHYNALPEFERILRQNRIQVPQHLGVVVVTQVLDNTSFSGIQGDPHLVGAWAVELLVSRIMNHDFGIPAQPRVEMVDGQWVDGRSLRPQRR